MKIRKETDIVAFLKQVLSCRGRVEFLTAQGDRLNLKSSLARYILAALCVNREISDSGEVLCENEEDCALLMQYMTSE